MKPTPPPILSRGRRILLDLILYIIAFILAVLFLVPDAESAMPAKQHDSIIAISTSFSPGIRSVLGAARQFFNRET